MKKVLAMALSAVMACSMATSFVPADDGVGCCVVVYLIAPIFDFLLSKVKPKILIGICIVLAALFAGDLVYSQVHPNMTPGAVEVKKEKEEPAAAPQQN